MLYYYLIIALYDRYGISDEQIDRECVRWK